MNTGVKRMFYDLGWRYTDYEDFVESFGYTSEEAEMLCGELYDIEMEERQAMKK